MIDELIHDLKPIVREELARSREEYEESFASRGEAYRITIEEVDEAKVEMEAVAYHMAAISKIPASKPLSSIGDVFPVYQHAMWLACEAIQVAAMAMKWWESPEAMDEEEST